jgi:predicted nucleic acid-binding protein
MRRIFVDTGAWDAIADRGDKNHKAALRFRDEIAGKCHLVSTNYVLDELYTLLLINVGFRKILEFKQHIDVLIREYILEIIWITDWFAKRAWEVFERFNMDKQWSFTDCTSYAVMNEMEISEVFAFDHHFDQMKFILKP